MPLGRQGKETTIWVGSGWIAVLRLFRNVGWDKRWASSGGSYWKLTARWIWGGSLAWKRFTSREPLNLKRVSTKYCGEILKRMLIQVKISYITPALPLAPEWQRVTPGSPNL